LPHLNRGKMAFTKRATHSRSVIRPGDQYTNRSGLAASASRAAAPRSQQLGGLLLISKGTYLIDNRIFKVYQSDSIAVLLVPTDGFGGWVVVGQKRTGSHASQNVLSFQCGSPSELLASGLKSKSNSRKCVFAGEVLPRELLH
jgi:hypothetical protein